MALNDSNTTKTGNSEINVDDEDDDLLLTQALNEQEAKTEVLSNTPPAKKVLNA